MRRLAILSVAVLVTLLATLITVLGEAVSAADTGGACPPAGPGVDCSTATVTATMSPTATITPDNASAAFPSTGLLDDFNRADGSVGSRWTGATNTGTYRVNASQLEVRNSGYAYWNAASFGPDQEAYVTVRRLSRGAAEQDLLLKVNGAAPDGGTGGNNFSAIEVEYDAVNHRVEVWTAVPYTPTRPTWVSHLSAALALADGDQLGGRARADGTVEIYRNGVLVGRTNVTQGPNAFPASLAAGGGRVGLWVIGATAADPSQMDDFGGGTIGP